MPVLHHKKFKQGYKHHDGDPWYDTKILADKWRPFWLIWYLFSGQFW